MTSIEMITRYWSSSALTNKHPAGLFVMFKDYESLHARVKELEADAKRYRYLRSNYSYAHETVYWDLVIPNPIVSLDSAIDAAMKEIE